MTFRKGQSGNPAGRRPGTGTSTSRLADLRKMLLSHAPALVGAVIESAMAGDTAAQKILIDRLIPTLRPVDQPVKIPTTTDDPATQSTEIVSLLLSGGLPANVAAQILQALQVQVELDLLQSIERRLAALEGANEPISGTGSGTQSLPVGNPE